MMNLRLPTLYFVVTLLCFIGVHTFGQTAEHGPSRFPHFQNSHKHVSVQHGSSYCEDSSQDEENAYTAIHTVPLFYVPAVPHGRHEVSVSASEAYSVKVSRFILLRSILV